MQLSLRRGVAAAFLGAGLGVMVLPQALGSPEWAANMLLMAGGILFLIGALNVLWPKPEHMPPSSAVARDSTGSFINIGRVDSFSMPDATFVGRDQIATQGVSGQQKPPLAKLQARSDMLRLKARRFRAENSDERVMWFHDLLPKEEWADYADVLDAWVAQLGVVIKNTDDATGYHDIKFKLPRQF